ncbi:MAG: hypothetical protein CR968_03850 [Flavobacteriia bacterium]|nr:MAG: hypothetical protein CR968_03850 [Flavobacteriia bacterium]
MKTLLYSLVILIGFNANLWANPEAPVFQKIEKEKRIVKTFKVSKDNLLTVDNRFGDVHIATGNTDQLAIEVVITAKSRDEKSVQEKLDDIDVIFSKKSNTVFAQTKITDHSGWFQRFRSSKVAFKIDYFIEMPVSNQLSISNDYGFIYIDELDGPCTLNCDYGGIVIGRLNNEENVINMDYGNKSRINYIKGGRINTDYSNIEILEANQLDLNADYTDCDIEVVGTLEFNNDYGEIRIGQADVVWAKADYYTLDISRLKHRLTFKGDYSNVNVLKTYDQLESIDISSDYTDVNVDLNGCANYKFSLKNSYGRIEFNGVKPEFTRKIIENSSQFYEGYSGSKNAKTSIRIDNSYGKINLQ